MAISPQRKPKVSQIFGGVPGLRLTSENGVADHSAGAIFFRLSKKTVKSLGPNDLAPRKFHAETVCEIAK